MAASCIDASGDTRDPNSAVSCTSLERRRISCSMHRNSTQFEQHCSYSFGDQLLEIQRELDQVAPVGVTLQSDGAPRFFSDHQCMQPINYTIVKHGIPPEGIRKEGIRTQGIRKQKIPRYTSQRYTNFLMQYRNTIPKRKNLRKFIWCTRGMRWSRLFCITLTLVSLAKSYASLISCIGSLASGRSVGFWHGSGIPAQQTLLLCSTHSAY